ncbi:MAG: SCO family protein [Fulvivirga sp.]|uniref:SCO family protein n=1 Tax=Fulvivirga sp. TaxID=1931237 RepID=UPI0032EF5537
MKQFLVLLIGLAVIACESQQDRLKIYGRSEVTDSGDTVYHKIADFKFVNQDSNWITQDTFKDKIYVADFFFTSCPTICPIMKTQMLRVYDKFENNPDVLILSHSIDPKHDSVAVLKEFADRLGVSSDKWHFITGQKEDIFKVGQTSYMVSASEDPTAPGGYLHSGAFILIDKERRVRGLYDGTKPEAVDKLMLDIDRLLKEYE